MTRDERILHDLSDNLRDKLAQNISDHFSLCRSAELSQKAVMTDLMILLVRLTAAFAAHQFNISPDDFGEVMGKQFEYSLRHKDDD